MKKFLILFFITLLFSCRTYDVDKNIKNQGAGSNKRVKNNAAAIEDREEFLIEPELVFIEQPVFVPPPEMQPKPSPKGYDAAVASNLEGIIKPSDYSHAAMLYNYNPDWVYEVYTQPLRVTDICLEPGESVLEAPFSSDTERWIIGAGISQQNNTHVQHIYIKPEIHGLTASLIINTDRRVYRLILRSFQNTFMPIVRWKYHTGIPNSFYTPTTPPISPLAINNDNPIQAHLVPIDPRFLSFNYRITHSMFSKPYWIPEFVFDDGSKTYIAFPAQVLQREMPSVFEKRRDILNHRVNGNMIIIDKLIEEITVKIDKKQITIKKKRN